MTSLALTHTDMRAMTESLPQAERTRATATAAALERFDLAADKAAAAEQIALELGPMGVSGLSVQSLYRKLADYRKRGWVALCDGRVLRANAPEVAKGGPATRPAFMEFWTTEVVANQRKTAPAYRRLFDRLAAGESIPGYGTWADIWREEHKGAGPGADMATSPYRAYAYTPRGWSYPSLMRLKPDAFVVTAGRIGMGRATAFLPEVPRTRVGLLRAQCVQIDDMWHNLKVMWGGNRKAQRVVQLSMVDVLTGKFMAWLCKPVRERDDGTRETLRQEWVKYFVGYLLCVAGYSRKGCLIMGEHGSAAADADLKAALLSLCGETVVFGAGGLMGQPMAKGLYDGRPRGNYKYKGMLESLHNVLQNDLADVQGQIGSRDSMDNEPEHVYGMDKATGGLVAAAIALEKTRPGIIDRLKMPYMPYWDYAALIDKSFDTINQRDWHKLEGWEGCGFMGGEYRLSSSEPWRSMDGLAPAAEQAVRAAITIDSSLWRQRRMSPGEAYESRDNDVTRLDAWAMPIILGPSLARQCECASNLHLDYHDETTMRRHTVAGILDTGEPLQRGASYMVWVNPLCADRAFVADASGRYLGTAPAMVAANPDDFEGLKHSLGVRQRALGAEIKRLRPVAIKRLREQSEAARVNCVEILGLDPASRLDGESVDALDYFAEYADAATM